MRPASHKGKGMELYIIRHGQSTNNVTMISGVNNRVVDPPLTDLGRQQAEALAVHLKTGFNRDVLVDPSWEEQGSQQGFGITALYCSPMLRTLQTCQPVSQALGLKPEVWIEIHEHGGLYVNYEDERGIVGFPGSTRAELLAAFPDYTLPNAITEQGWWNPALGEEDLAGAQARAIRVAAALRAKGNSQEHIVLVTHGTFADCLLKALLYQLPTKEHFFAHYNTGITRVTFIDQGRLRIRYTNRIDHLTPEMTTA
jgi:broad specificity phosphatase PhoE